jgi:site-specific DNA recombinase
MSSSRSGAPSTARGAQPSRHRSRITPSTPSGRGANDIDHARIEAAKHKIEDCDSRLAKYRAATDAGDDPVIVAGWMAEVQGERLEAEREIGLAQGAGQLTRAQVHKLVESLKDVVAVLATADPKLKAEVYEELGVSVTYDPTRNVAKLESRPATPWARVRVGGGT